MITQNPLIEAVRKVFRGSFSRIDTYEDGVRCRWWPDTDIFVMASGEIIGLEQELSSEKRRVANILKKFVTCPEMWYTRYDAERFYSIYDAVVVRIPDGYYPIYIPWQRREGFDVLRPFYRILGGSPFGKKIIRRLELSGGNVIRQEACDCVNDIAFADEFMAGLGIASWAIGKVPYDAPVDDLRTAIGEGPEDFFEWTLR